MDTWPLGYKEKGYNDDVSARVRYATTSNVERKKGFWLLCVPSWNNDSLFVLDAVTDCRLPP